MVIRYIILTLFFLVLSCTRENTISPPEFGENSILKNATLVPQFTQFDINGVYDVIDGKDKFGNQVIVKWTGKFLSIFSQKNDTYFVMKSGILGSDLVFEGYWRVPIGSTIGSVQMTIAKLDGAESLINSKKPDSITIQGKVFTDSKNSTSITLKLNHRFANSKPFYIIAHRGGGRNADRLPASENSLEIIRLAEGFGANGIEIDIRLTKDGVPILYHDDDFNTRLVNSDILIGAVTNYNYFQIKNYATLKQGEMIPTLEEALNTIIYETSIEIVWLDVKTIEVMDKIIPLQINAIKKAKEAGRNIIFLLGLPTPELYDKYLSLPTKKAIVTLCEIGYNQTIEANSLVWAPRWTLGVPYNEGLQLHEQKKYLFTWTLDQKEFILKFLNENIYDGILSNYPSIVAFQYYMKQ